MKVCWAEVKGWSNVALPIFCFVCETRSESSACFTGRSATYLKGDVVSTQTRYEFETLILGLLKTKWGKHAQSILQTY